MAAPVEQSSFRASAISPGLLSQTNPTALANRMLQESQMLGGRDVASLGASLKQLGTTDPKLAATVQSDVTAQLTPVEQGELLRTASTPISTAAPTEMAVLQRDNFAAYVEKLRPTLAPQDQNNPFAYSLGTDVPIEVKRQVYAEWQGGQNGPRVEIGSMAGANASFDEGAGPNGTIRVNADLIGNKDPARKGQFEAFAVWGHLEEIGHWGDMRAQQLMGRPGGDSLGDEGARFAYMSLPSVTSGANPNSFQANYDIKLSNGTTQTVQFDSVVLKALAAEKLSSGSFARENRVGNVEHFGPEGHYQTTYLTAAGVGTGLGLNEAENDRIANRLALGSQLPDMLEHYDATEQGIKSVKERAIDALNPIYPIGRQWTDAEQKHLAAVYRGLHALPYNYSDQTIAWRDAERTRNADFIRNAIASGDFVSAGVAIHRYGDSFAHTDIDSGVPFAGVQGHAIASKLRDRNPDDMYLNPSRMQNTRNYQTALSTVITDGLIQRQRNLGRAVEGDARTTAINGGVAFWSAAFNASSNEKGFSEAATRLIGDFHKSAKGSYNPLTYLQMGVEGKYSASQDEINSLDRVMNSLK
jgi:hypothetical protein